MHNYWYTGELNISISELISGVNYGMAANISELDDGNDYKNYYLQINNSEIVAYVSRGSTL